jgi:hypothetical protein
MKSMRGVSGPDKLPAVKENPFDLLPHNQLKGREERLLLAGKQCCNE